ETSNTSPNGTGASCVAHTPGVTRSVATLKQLTDLDTYWNAPDVKGIADQPAGYNADPNDKSTMSFRDNFTGFWNTWKHGIITRDYALLDEIYPNRIRSAEEWFRREDQVGRELGKGSLWERVQPENWSLDSAILKSSADMRTGKL
ncbi:hypothetical protein ABZY05_49830, partial [Streptomyces canus]|uniref:hypothetical protein n=1 Tax=Streptomyces canus TaxID=58343 RepID=UPI0033B132F7